MKKRDFPKNFIWGTATASYQIEGGALEDGKGPSIWNEFELRPGAISDNVTGDVTSDEYHRWREDVSLMAGLGVNAYRFSVAWSRIFPDGRGKLNRKGMDYYLRLCDELLAKGIEPYVTLYHWDLPLALQKDFGGWESRETVKYFADYTAAVSREFGDRVKHYFTLNELLGCVDQGYANGITAPGLKIGDKRRNQARHHLLLAHGYALQTLRAAAPHAKVGMAENPWFTIPVMETPEHINSAKKAFREMNAHFLTAIMEGGYPEYYLREAGKNSPVVKPGDFDLISAPMDFLGLNVYFGRYVRNAPERERGYQVYTAVPHDKDVLFTPSSAYWACRMVSELWAPEEILISENGLGVEDRPDERGEINDVWRIKYLHHYLASVAQAVADGYPVKGYFHWSLLDNLEWSSGFRARFGLYFVNFRTGERIPKLSSRWYAELIRTGRIR